MATLFSHKSSSFPGPPVPERTPLCLPPFLPRRGNPGHVSRAALRPPGNPGPAVQPAVWPALPAPGIPEEPPARNPPGAAPAQDRLQQAFLKAWP